MNWIQYARAKVGLGGWLPPYCVGEYKIYRWEGPLNREIVEYHFTNEGMVREQVKGTHPIYPKSKLHPRGTFKYDSLKCQLLALDDGIYYPPKWWQDAVNFHLFADGKKLNKTQQKQFDLVEKYINKEV